MLTITKIVVPVDLHKNTEKLVDYALFIAKNLDAEVIFFHAVEFVVLGEMALGNPSYDDYNTDRLKKSRNALEDITEKSAGKCKNCTCKAVIGDTVDEILDIAKEEKAGLIIMGTHGKRGLEKILLGSVAERVLKSAPCPVLVMNPYK
jgi:nucleotide-binding universal stress UspA family protein